MQSSEGEQRWRAVQGQLTESAQRIYASWVTWVVEEERVRLRSGLAQVPWHAMTVHRIGWQAHAINEQSEQVCVKDPNPHPSPD